MLRQLECGSTGAPLPEPMLADRSWQRKYMPDDGDLVTLFYVPALKDAARYDRLTGYFSACALALAVAALLNLERVGIPTCTEAARLDWMSLHGHSVIWKTMKTAHGAVHGGRHFRTRQGTGLCSWSKVIVRSGVST